MLTPYRPILKKPVKKPASAAAPVTGCDAGRIRRNHRQSRSITDDDGSNSDLHSSPIMKKQRREDKATPESESATEPFFVTPLPASLPSNESNVVNVKVLMETIESLKIKNILLERKIAELGSLRVDLKA